MTTQTYHAPDFTAPLLARAPGAQFEPIPADGVLPEGFFSTSNLPTYVRVGERWVLPRRPRMDCVIVKRGDDLEVIEPRRLKKGDAIAIGLAEDGSQGIYVHTEGFLGGSHSANEFRFMSTEVSRERPVNYEELAARLNEEKAQGGYLIWVAGPALVHSRARGDFEWFIRNGYVQAVLAGNAVAVAVRADVADGLDVERLFAETIEEFGAVDVVVHAVRGRARSASLADSDPAEFEALCRINTGGTFLVNREAARRLRDGGSIVNLTSSAFDGAVPRHGVDATTSAAVEALTRVLALELHERDITVNAVALDFDRPCAPERVAEVVVSLLGNGHVPTGTVIHEIDPGAWRLPTSAVPSGDTLGNRPRAAARVR